MKDSRYIIGIDLGTTNSTVAYIDTKEKSSADKTSVNNGIKCDGFEIKIFHIPQLVSENAQKKLNTLPSYLYLPGEYELSATSYSLDWCEGSTEQIVGEFARIKGAKVPANLVASAKSWLCHNRVDRKGPILPWGREDGTGRISPVKASELYLRHLKDAWNHEMAKGRTAERLENQQIVLTIPASFDESARELTQEAAKEAGFKYFSMLEEPQAAFYSWIASNDSSWSDKLEKDRLILVFDVGGGTTDFNLINISSDDMAFQRVAVGEHLMLGGDNMDLALAHEVEQKITAGKKRLNLHQWLSLAHQCRFGKETLLGEKDEDSAEPEKEKFALTLLGTGRSVIGGAIKSSLTKEEVERIVLKGFFKDVKFSESVEHKRAGFQELGLPYVSDPAVMKHLAYFLKQHNVNKDLPQVVDNETSVSIVRPDVVLFNGGVFKSPIIRQYAKSCIESWFQNDTSWNLTVLDNIHFDHAVSLGAAYYGTVVRGKGVRISGGTARAYYIKVETAAKTEPDKEMINPLTCLCVLPRGSEEGQEIYLKEQEFQVRTNSPVSFALFYSSYRVGDKAGDTVCIEKDELLELPAIKTVLHYGKKSGSVKIPVTLGVKLNEYGTLDVWCESTKTPHKWRLAFQVREDVFVPEKEDQAEHLTKGDTIDETTLENAIVLIREGFEAPLKSSPPAPVTVENLNKKLSQSLELDKSKWPLVSIRGLWDELINLKEKRKTTPKHEARWLNLAGFFLRPGFGHPADEWRIKELWKVFSEGLVFARDGQCRVEWWILWRRIAGGLSEKNQEYLYKKLTSSLMHGKSKKGSIKHSSSEFAEIWMLVASLEHLKPDIKAKLGDELLKLVRNEKSKAQGNFFWALSRVGARMSFYSPIEKTVPPAVVSRWIKELLNLDQPDEVAYAVTQIGRKTGDRTRDIDDTLRDTIVQKLTSAPYKNAMKEGVLNKYIRELTETVTLEREDEKAVFGESLPDGLFVETK